MANVFSDLGPHILYTALGGMSCKDSTGSATFVFDSYITAMGLLKQFKTDISTQVYGMHPSPECVPIIQFVRDTLIKSFRLRDARFPSITTADPDPSFPVMDLCMLDDHKDVIQFFLYLGPMVLHQALHSTTCEDPDALHQFSFDQQCLARRISETFRTVRSSDLCYSNMAPSCAGIVRFAKKHILQTVNMHEVAREHPWE